MKLQSFLSRFQYLHLFSAISPQLGRNSLSNLKSSTKSYHTFPSFWFVGRGDWYLAWGQKVIIFKPLLIAIFFHAPYRSVAKWFIGSVNPFSHNDTFWRPWETSLWKTLWEIEKLLVTSNFSFTHSVFYPLRELSGIFMKFKIVVCRLFQFGPVLNLSSGIGLIIPPQFFDKVTFDKRKKSAWNDRAGAQANRYQALWYTCQFVDKHHRHRDITSNTVENKKEVLVLHYTTLFPQENIW